MSLKIFDFDFIYIFLIALTLKRLYSFFRLEFVAWIVVIVVTKSAPKTFQKIVRNTRLQKEVKLKLWREVDIQAQSILMLELFKYDTIFFNNYFIACSFISCSFLPICRHPTINITNSLAPTSQKIGHMKATYTKEEPY